MRRVFIDTNILIDFVENRPGADAAEKVLENGANKVISLFASPLTFANMAYILGKRFDKEKLYPMLCFNTNALWLATVMSFLPEMPKAFQIIRSFLFYQPMNSSIYMFN